MHTEKEHAPLKEEKEMTYVDEVLKGLENKYPEQPEYLQEKCPAGETDGT